MAKRDATDGERLCTFIGREVLRRGCWSQLSEALYPVARANELAEFFEQITAVQMAGRLVKGGRSIVNRLVDEDPIGSPEFDRLFRELVSETTELRGGNYLHERKRLVILAKQAVRASFEAISGATRESVFRFAHTRHRQCYLCGRALLLYVAPDQPLNETEEGLQLEMEHIWPQSYGGNSDEDNLLPACRSCNRQKDDYANWSMVDVQSLNLGWDPDTDTLRRISGRRRFSILSRAATKRAELEGITLKQAFLKLGPAVDPYVRSRVDVADFFNIHNHVMEE